MVACNDGFGSGPVVCRIGYGRTKALNRLRDIGSRGWATAIASASQNLIDIGAAARS